MKRTILIMAALIAIALTAAFIIDSKLYYYGKNEWGIHDKLPFTITPQYWGYDYGNLGFVLLRDDEAFIAHGLKYWTSDVQVNEIIKYGFNKEKLVTLVNDSVGKEYYIECLKNNDIQSKQDLKITVIAKDSFIDNELLKWVDIKSVSTERMEIARNYLEIFVIILLFITVYYMVKQRKGSAPNQSSFLI